MQHLEAAIITVGLEMGIFKQLASSTAPMTVAELSRQADAEPQLLSKSSYRSYVSPY